MSVFLMKISYLLLLMFSSNIGSHDTCLTLKTKIKEYFVNDNEIKER